MLPTLTLPSYEYLRILIKASNGLLQDMFTAVKVALWPTLQALRASPKLLLEPRELSRLFMARAWVPIGDGIDENARKVKEDLVTQDAEGVVLDLGAGYGHLAAYLDRTRVTAYIALEPNTNMHIGLRAKAASYGFTEADGNFLIISCGAEDIERICDELGRWAFGNRKCTFDRSVSHGAQGPGMVINTIVSILTICSLPSPAQTLRALIHRTLLPGGQLLFYEHVRNPRPIVAQVQDTVAPLWRRFFDGCIVGLDAGRAIWEAGFPRAPSEGETEMLLPTQTNGSDENHKEQGGWEDMRTWGLDGEDTDHLFWHQIGRCVKKSD